MKEIIKEDLIINSHEFKSIEPIELIEKLTMVATYSIPSQDGNFGEYQKMEPLFDELEREIIKNKILKLITNI
jgi:hypothetical protein